jgi:anti-sigma regulatory factor (Ser/Thr protein kinase)
MTSVRHDWKRELLPNLEQVERFCDEFRVFCSTNCARLDAFTAELLLREALTNAVRHGGRSNARQRISCTLRAKPASLLIVIRDGGHGFNWAARGKSCPDPSATGGRGIAILRKYASAVRFNREGNMVALFRRF